MLVVPFACAEFHDKSGNVIHRIHAHELRNITEVPDAIVQDPLYALMVEEGSLKAPESKIDLKALENDPDAAIAKAEKRTKTAKTAKAAKTEKTETAAKTEKTEKAEKSAMEPAKTENALSAIFHICGGPGPAGVSSAGQRPLFGFRPGHGGSPKALHGA